MPIYRQIVECSAADLELALAECYGRGAFSIEEQDLPGDRVRLLVYYHEPIEGSTVVDDSIDWQSVSEQPWTPIEIGERLWLVPPWLNEDPPPGRRRLNYIRGQACGTGGHAATQVCLTAMDKYLKPGMSFLDVGAGSGILSVAADLLDADTIVGCDIDHPSVVIAAQNSSAPFFTGSVRSVRDHSFDMIAANINATMLSNIGGELKRVLRPGGYLIGGGFRSNESPDVPLRQIERFEHDGWSATVYS